MISYSFTLVKLYTPHLYLIPGAFLPVLVVNYILCNSYVVCVHTVHVLVRKQEIAACTEGQNLKSLQI